MSVAILPKNSSVVNTVNDVTFESLRLSFLTNMKEKTLYHCAKVIKDWLDSTLVPNSYEYGYATNQWKKDAVNTTKFTEAELMILISESFVADVANVIIDDYDAVYQAKKTELDGMALNTQAERDVVSSAMFDALNNKNDLNAYKRSFLNYETMVGSIIAMLKVLIAIDA